MSLIEKMLINRVSSESKIASASEKSGNSRNREMIVALMGSRARLYLRLEVSSTGVVDGRRSEECRRKRMQSKLGIHAAESGKA